MTQPYTKPAPIREQRIEPLPGSELHRLAVQAEMLRKAETGDAEALEWVKAKLVRWERMGRRIV